MTLKNKEDYYATGESVKVQTNQVLLKDLFREVHILTIISLQQFGKADFHLFAFRMYQEGISKYIREMKLSARKTERTVTTLVTVDGY